MPIPALVGRPSTKTNNDILVYATTKIGIMERTKLRTDIGLHVGTIGCCGGQPTDEHCSCPDPSIQATVTMNKNRGMVGPIGIHAPLYTSTIGHIDPVGMNDMVAHVCLPDPGLNLENFQLICFDQGASPKPGVSHRAIPRKYNPIDHYVRQRPENTITLNDLFVASPWGLNRFRGIPCTILIAVTYEGTGLFTELQFYNNVLLNPTPMNAGSDGNASIDISMEGPFSFCAIFTNPTTM
jgi:hypothetical protein